MNGSDDASVRLRHSLNAFFITFAMWLLLVGSLNQQELLAALFVSGLLAIVSFGHRPILAGIRWTPTAPISFIRYLGVFFVALVKANIDMARRVVAPEIPISPSLVRVRTDLKSDLGRLALANSITLTPGTLTVDLEGDEFIVHWIDQPASDDIAETTRVIAARFEQHLRGFLR